MKIKSIATAVLIAGTIGTVGQAKANTFNGKTTAMADAGVATSDYLEGMNLNPAALANYEDNQDFNLHLNLGLVGADEDDLLDSADDLADTLDRVDGRALDVPAAEAIIRDLLEIDGKHALVEAGGGIYMNIPTRLVSLGLYARTSMTVGVAGDVVESDIGRIAESVVSGASFDTDTLESAVTATGAAVTEAGVNLARRHGNTSYGMTLKHQRVDIIEYVARVDNFDQDDFDADDYRTDDANLNIDLGVQHRIGRWRVGATVANLVEHDYRSVSGREVTLEPRLTLGGGYRNNWLTAALDVDANATANMITGEDSRFVRLGFEADAWGWAQLRVGYKSDLESVFEDTASLGLGFSPFGVLNMDLSVVAGEKDTVGASLQMGFSF